jgi:hypothetical protein
MFGLLKTLSNIFEAVINFIFLSIFFLVEISNKAGFKLLVYAL